MRQQMEELMKVVDLETMSTKQFIAALSDKFGGVDLSSKKKFIKASITEIIDAMEKNDEGSDDESSEEEEEVAKPPPKKKKGGGGGGGGGLSAEKEISAELADFLQCGRHMARTAIVKSMWDYIKENDLQNPDNKREILLDPRMKAVFGVDSFTMFSMNKYISSHVEPYKPVDLTTSSTPKKRKAKANPGEKGAKKRSGGGGGFQAPYRLSDDLAAVVGQRQLSRAQVTQGLWAYIRENELQVIDVHLMFDLFGGFQFIIKYPQLLPEQNPEDKREIICDEQLSRVMGGESRVTMFTMNKYITPHMLEKVEMKIQE
ncbi:hypothetical protein ACHAWF_002024 [Thalassiosira exigua]